MDKGSRIYVAGPTGLLGSSLINALKTQGYINLLLKKHSELDLTDKVSVFQYFAQARPEYVFLAAGLNGGIKVNKTCPADFYHVNIAIQDNVFEAAQKYSVTNLIFYGSSCMYPKNIVQPIKEERLLTGEIEVTSEAYAAAKIAGTLACRAYNRQYQTKRFIALVPNSMFGPRDHFDPDNAHVFSALIRKFHEAKIASQPSVVLWGSGAPRREFVYVDDIAEASIFAMNNADRLENHQYNVGSGRDFSIKELAELIAAVVGYKGMITWDTAQPDGSPRKLLDSSKFLALGWAPRTEIKAGLEKTYDWFVKNGN